MIRINQIKLKPEQGMGGQEPEILENKIRKLLGLSERTRKLCAIQQVRLYMQTSKHKI